MSSSLLFSGCATTKQPSPSLESPQEVESALESVAGTLAGKKLTPEEFESLKKQVQTDEEARTAVETITEGFQKPLRVKYCPLDGERYAARFDVCPVHGVKLEWVEE